MSQIEGPTFLGGDPICSDGNLSASLLGVVSALNSSEMVNVEAKAHGVTRGSGGENPTYFQLPLCLHP